MDADAPPALPVAIPPGSPFRPEPEQPRLGIIHLLVWTACVAVYFSATRAVYPNVDEVDQPGFVLYWMATGLGSGTALGGLLLWAVRRYQGFAFPNQPGEWILVLLGVDAGAELLSFLTAFLTVQYDGPMVSSAPVLVTAVLAFSRFVVLSGLYLVASARTKIPRWRLCLLTLAIANLLHCLPVVRLLSSAVLVTVVLKDLFAHIRYRWTHWLGVALEFWSSAVSVGWLGFWLFFFYSARP